MIKWKIMGVSALLAAMLGAGASLAQEGTPDVTPEVTGVPTLVPTDEVTAEPTVEATSEATVEATTESTVEATQAATSAPTSEATSEATVVPTSAPSDVGEAEIINDEGGVTIVQGEMAYTNLLLLTGIAQPLVLLEDAGGFVVRDYDFQFPLESQVMGQFVTDLYTSPVQFTVSLPIQPQGTLRDVDNDDETDTGVMTFSVAFWTNTFGDPFLEVRDQGGGGWSSDYASMLVDPGTREVVGGKYLIYAPDEGQGYPSGFGDDGLLFTEDDPIVSIPQGYSVVNLDAEPFTFDRSAVASIDILESSLTSAKDFSELSYTDAFDSMIDLFRQTYAFTEYKNLDWDAISAEFRPRFEAAEADGDADAYLLALRDFTWSIPDGHVGLSVPSPYLDELFAQNTDGGLGLSLAELSDGRFIISYILPDGPADAAGIGVGAEVFAINGVDIDTAVSENVPYSSPFSNAEALRLQQLRYVVRFPVNEDVQITVANPGSDEQETIALTTIAERASFNVSSFSRGLRGVEPPVTYDVLDSGYGYAKIYSFFSNEILTVELFEEFLNLMNANGIPGIILDLRQNGGGSGLLADQMAGYFVDEPFINGYSEYYSEQTGQFEGNFDSPGVSYPAPEAFRYEGEVVVLVGPACASACEFFSYNMQIGAGATIIGQYPSAGLGGGVNDFIMPEGAVVRYTIGRQLGPDREIHLENIGVVPDVLVPVDEITVFSTGDPVLEAGVAYLNEVFGIAGEATSIAASEGGEIALGEPIEGEIAAGERIRYTFTSESDVTVNITLGDEDGELDTYLRVYDEGEALIAENDDIELGVDINSLIEGVLVAEGDTILVEVGTYADADEGTYTLEVTESAEG